MEQIILQIVKSRLNRMDTALDEYLIARIQAAVSELEAAGIHVRDDSRDNVFVADFVVWEYQNRDERANRIDGGDRPAWLRAAIRDRWLQDGGRES